MLKKLMIGILVLVLIAAGGVYFLFSNLDSIVKAAIEKYGTQATGTEVTLSSVKISTSTGEGTISGLVIKNPKDFNTPNAFELGSISVTIDTKSLWGDGPIVIHEIDIKTPKVTFEVDNSGRSNLQTIEKNTQSYAAPANTSTGTSPKSDNGGSGKPDRKIIISDLYIHDGQVQLSHALLKGKEITTPLPTIHLTNIGKDSGGASPAQIAKQVIGTVTAVSLKDSSAALAKQVSGTLNDTLNKAGAGNVGDVGNQIKGLLR